MEDTPEEIHRSGHRRFVGGGDGFWDQVGDLQFRFLCEHGLNPADTFIDVACGSLRGGVNFIRYLEPGRYLGIDKHIELVIYGVALELGLETFREKRPRFVISDRFEFEKFGERPTFGIAQSLFTHLAAPDIDLCLSKLRRIAAPGCRLYATFFETDMPETNPEMSGSHGHFVYTRAQMEDFGSRADWQPRYIGGWNHPRQQNIIEYAVA